MGYAAATLELNGYQPQVIDACAARLSAEAFLARVGQINPDLMLLETSIPSFVNDSRLVAKLKKEFPRMHIAMAGAWQHPQGKSPLEETPEVDFFLVGEYEETLLELVQALEKNISPAGIKSLEFWENDEIRRNPLRQLTSKLDSIPFPARHLFPMERYEDLAGELPMPALQLWGSRGCPFGCIFCVWPQVMYRSRTYRIRSPQSIVDEIEQECGRFPYRSLYFDDDTFNIGKERMLEFCAELTRRNISLPWAIMARADTSDRETLLAMRKAGLASAKFGLESASQALVDRAHKNLDLETAFDRIKYARSLGIKTHLTFTFGLPGETTATIKKTVDTALELDPESVQFSILTPFPGSELFADLYREKRLTSLDFADYDGYTKAVFRSDTLSPAVLEKACRFANLKWGKHILKRALFHDPIGLLAKALRKPAKLLGFLVRALRRNS